MARAASSLPSAACASASSTSPSGPSAVPGATDRHDFQPQRIGTADQSRLPGQRCAVETQGARVRLVLRDRSSQVARHFGKQRACGLRVPVPGTHPRQRDLRQGQVLVPPLGNVAVSRHQSFGDPDRAHQAGARLRNFTEVQLSLAEHGMGHRGPVCPFQVVGLHRQQLVEGARCGLGLRLRLQQFARRNLDLGQSVRGRRRVVADQRIVGASGRPWHTWRVASRAVRASATLACRIRSASQA